MSGRYWRLLYNACNCVLSRFYWDISLFNTNTAIPDSWHSHFCFCSRVYPLGELPSWWMKEVRTWWNPAEADGESFVRVCEKHVMGRRQAREYGLINECKIFKFEKFMNGYHYLKILNVQCGIIVGNESIIWNFEHSVENESDKWI